MWLVVSGVRTDLPKTPSQHHRQGTDHDLSDEQKANTQKLRTEIEKDIQSARTTDTWMKRANNLSALPLNVPEESDKPCWIEPTEILAQLPKCTGTNKNPPGAHFKCYA